MKTKTAAALGIERLYHYQSFDKPERLARVFTDGTLYFSRPRDFNDPGIAGHSSTSLPLTTQRTTTVPSVGLCAAIGLTTLLCRGRAPTERDGGTW